MTDRIKDITRAVVYEVYLAMGDDGLNALLTADGDIYKPYAIINDHTFAAAEKELRK